MDLKDMILVTENYNGTEKNMLMTLEDYKKFVSIKDMSELAEHMLLLGRTLAQGEGFAEYYRAANVTVFAKFCSDDVELGRFLQGYYSDFQEFHFDKAVMNMKSGSLTIALGATEYDRYPKGKKPTKDNTTIGVSWEHGIYLDSMPSQINFKAYKAKYGIPERMENLYDYRAMLKRKYYFLEALSKDDDIPDKIQNAILSHIYAEYKTLEEDTFLDRLDDGKYDAGFEKEKERLQEKSR